MRDPIETVENPIENTSADSNPVKPVGNPVEIHEPIQILLKSIENRRSLSDFQQGQQNLNRLTDFQ